MIPKTMVMSVQVVLICALFLAGAGCTHASPQADITRAEMKTVPVGDITIAYKEVGSGEPLVLIMGYSGTMDLWDPRVVNQLAEQYRVIIFDNRGMGHTTSSDKEYSIRLFADDTAGLMDALKIEKADVMGFSMGTNIAQELTLDYPEKVDKLILYAGDPGGKEALSPAPQDLESIQNTTGTDRERGERLFKEMFPPVWLKENPDPSKYFPNVTSMSPAENVRRQYTAMMTWNGSYSPAPGYGATAPADNGRPGSPYSSRQLTYHHRKSAPVMGRQDAGWRTWRDVPVSRCICQHRPHVPFVWDLIRKRNSPPLQQGAFHTGNHSWDRVRAGIPGSLLL